MKNLDLSLVFALAMLYLPAATDAQTEKDLFYKKHIVDLGEFTSGCPSRFTGQAHLAVSPSGNAGYVAWNVAGSSENGYAVGDLHITPLNAAFKRSGADLVLGELIINDILATDETSITLLAGEIHNNTYVSVYPNEIYILKIDLQGKILWKTLISGGDGHGPQAQWPDYAASDINLAFNGTEYAAYFSLMKNWADPGESDDIHQGDLFAVVTKEGKRLDSRTLTWRSSHSNILYLAPNDAGEFTTVNTGDGYPFGVVYSNVNTAKSQIIWPPKDVRDKKDDHTVTWVGTAGQCGGIVHKNGLVYVLINTDLTDKLLNGDTKNPDNSAMILLKLDETGSILNEYWLSQQAYEGGEARMVAYGSGFAIVNNNAIPYDENAPFGASFSPNAVVRVINSSGQLTQGPVELLRSMYSNDDEVISLPNGGIAWASVRFGSQYQIEITELLAPNAPTDGAFNATKDNAENVRADNYAGVIDFLKPLDAQKFNGIITLNGDQISTEGLVCDGAYGSVSENGLSIQYNDFNYSNFSIEARFNYTEAQAMPVFVLSSYCRLVTYQINADGMVELQLNNGSIKVNTEVACTKGSWHTARIEYKNGSAAIYLDNEILAKQSVVLTETCAKGNTAEINVMNYSNGNGFKGVISSITIH